MICSRCGQLLLEDRFMDWAARWRCMKCGQVYDSKNVNNHIENEHNRLFTKSCQPEYSQDEVYLGLERASDQDRESIAEPEGRAGRFVQASGGHLGVWP